MIHLVKETETAQDLHLLLTEEAHAAHVTVDPTVHQVHQVQMVKMVTLEPMVDPENQVNLTMDLHLVQAVEFNSVDVNQVQEEMMAPLVLEVDLVTLEPLETLALMEDQVKMEPEEMLDLQVPQVEMETRDQLVTMEDQHNAADQLAPQADLALTVNLVDQDQVVEMVTQDVTEPQVQLVMQVQRDHLVNLVVMETTGQMVNQVQKVDVTNVHQLEHLQAIRIKLISIVCVLRIVQLNT